jgi:hypothetical protein
MTALGGLAHTLPFLVPSFTVVITIAAAVVVVELLVIAWIRNRYMDTPLCRWHCKWSAAACWSSQPVWRSAAGRGHGVGTRCVFSSQI